MAVQRGQSILGYVSPLPDESKGGGKQMKEKNSNVGDGIMIFGFALGLAMILMSILGVVIKGNISAIAIIGIIVGFLQIALFVNYIMDKKKRNTSSHTHKPSSKVKGGRQRQHMLVLEPPFTHPHTKKRRRRR